MNNIYHQTLRIPCYDTDAAQLLKPVSFMNYAQEMANCHASILGFGYDDMIRTRTAWVLSRMHIKFLCHPKWRETVNLRTWHKGPEGLFYLRDFRMTDEQDKTDLAVATTSWLVVNMDTRRLTRDALLDEDSICREHALDTPCDKVRIPSQCAAEPASVHKVSYSDVDLNGHANNAMYVQWAMDAVSSDVTREKPLKELKINFNHEVMPDESVSLFRASAGDTYYIEGKIPDGEGRYKSSFCVELAF